MAFSAILTAHVRLIVEATGKTGLLMHKYRKIFVLVLVVIGALLTAVE